MFVNKGSSEQRTHAPVSEQAETKKCAPPGALYDEDEDEGEPGSPHKNAFVPHALHVRSRVQNTHFQSKSCLQDRSLH
jgi:hypothetical protein